jgi:hypothetical protein
MITKFAPWCEVTHFDRMSLKLWLDTITSNTLLDLAPHGFLVGCGGTSEYLAYAVKTRPPTEEALFTINRQGSYNGSSINELSFSVAKISSALDEIDSRLDRDGYVRISFDDGREDTDEELTLEEIVRNRIRMNKAPPSPKLFDHSFLLLKTDDVWRFESYINQYAPQAVVWNTYRNDLEELVKSPLESWERVFGVRCAPEHDLSKVKVVVTS